MKPVQERRFPKRRDQTHATQKLKLVIRRLPPTLPKRVMQDLVKPFDPTFFEFISGKPAHIPHESSRTLSSSGSLFQTAKPARLGRCYVAFDKIESLQKFVQEFGSTRSFVDKQGQRWDCVVEFAPNSLVPQFKGTVFEPLPLESHDPKQGTIDKDEDFLDFCKLLLSPPEEEIAESLDSPSSTTPIIAMLRERAEQRKQAKGRGGKVGGVGKGASSGGSHGGSKKKRGGKVGGLSSGGQPSNGAQPTGTHSITGGTQSTTGTQPTVPNQANRSSQPSKSARRPPQPNQFSQSDQPTQPQSNNPDGTPRNAKKPQKPRNPPQKKGQANSGQASQPTSKPVIPQ